MSNLEVNVGDKANVGFVGNNKIHGDVKIDQSKSKTVFNYGTQKEHNGKIRSFHFDLETLQREGVIANRADELAKIRSALQQDTRNGAKVAILKGIGGAGKTTLAKIYANVESSSKEPFDNLIWINGQSSTKVEEDFQELLKNYLDIRRKVAGKQLADAVYNSILKHKTLIVFDNVENAEDISHFLPTVPQPPYPQLIITTRNKLEMSGYEKHWVPVDVLSFEVSQVYIREKLAKSPLLIPDIDEKWEELATYFGRLVIALRASTVSIVKENERREYLDEEDRVVYTLDMYLTEIEKVPILEVNTSDPDDPAEVTYKALRQIWTKNLNDDLPSQPEGEQAERILQVLAFLAPSGVPERWFRTLLSKFLNPNDKNSVRTQANAKRLLVSWSLMEISDGKLVIHRLLQTTLLSRLKTAPEQRLQMLDWSLPGMVDLYSKLWKEKKLENFQTNLDNVLVNIGTDITEAQVPEPVVSFLVNLNLPGMKACETLIKKLIRNVFESRVSVKREGLNLLVTSLQVVDSVLLLPQWIQEFNREVPISEQLSLVSKSVHLTIPNFLTNFRFDCWFSSTFYLEVAQVVENWKPQPEDFVVNARAFQTALNVLSCVDRLCRNLSGVLDGRLAIQPESRHRGLSCIEMPASKKMLFKLEKGLVAVSKVLFRKSGTKTEDLEAMFKYVQVAIRWYMTAVDVESHFKTELLVDISELDGVLKLAGSEETMLESYLVQLERYYRDLDCGPISKDRFKKIQLEARMAAAFLGILNMPRNSLDADAQQNLKNIKQEKATYVPFEMIPLMESCLNWENFWCKISTKYSVLKAHFVCVGLEPHLELLEENLKETCEKNSVQDNIEFVRGLEAFVSVFKNIIDFHRKYRDETPTLTFFKESGATKPAEITGNLFPNWQKCAQVMDKVFARYSKIIRSSHTVLSFRIAVSKDSSDPKNLVTILEEFYDRHPKGRDQNAKDRDELRQALQEAYKKAVAMAESMDTSQTCQCIVSRYERMLAGLELEQGDTEAAIEVASKAFDHQLYCPKSYRNIIETVQILLDAYSESQDAQTRSKDLLRRLIADHVGYIQPDVKEDVTTKMSQSKLVRYLCSVGATLEAADYAESFLKETPVFDVEGVSILAMFLLLRGENERARKILECLRLQRKRDYLLRTGNPRHPTEFEVISHKRTFFSYTLETIAATRELGLGLPPEFNLEYFRGGAFTYVHYIAEDNGKYSPKAKQWLADKVHFEELFKAGKRKSWCEKNFDVTQPLEWNLFVILWFDTMETILFQARKEFLDGNLFETLKRQLELRGSKMKFRLVDDTPDWGIKCLLGMYQRQEFWFQKAAASRSVKSELDKKWFTWFVYFVGFCAILSVVINQVLNFI